MGELAERQAFSFYMVFKIRVRIYDSKNVFLYPKCQYLGCDL